MGENVSGRLKVLSILLLAVAGIAVAAQLWRAAPDPQVRAEEAQIFNADDAQWFGEEPLLLQSVRLLAVDEHAGRWRARLTVAGQERFVDAGKLLQPPCLYLAEVLEEAVLLNSCGAYRLVSLAAGGGEFQYRNVGQRDVWLERERRIVDLRADKAVSRLLGEYLQRLYSAPLSLRGTVELERRNNKDGSPHYYLYPGSDKRLFSLLPLRGGDRLHAVNGVSLAAAEALTELYESLDEVGDVTLTIEREAGEVLVLLLSAPAMATGRLAAD